jgi:hypothetical protein
MVNNFATASKFLAHVNPDCKVVDINLNSGYTTVRTVKDNSYDTQTYHIYYLKLCYMIKIIPCLKDIIVNCNHDHNGHYNISPTQVYTVTHPTAGSGFAILQNDNCFIKFTGLTGDYFIQLHEYNDSLSSLLPWSILLNEPTCLERLLKVIDVFGTESIFTLLCDSELKQLKQWITTT